MPEGASGLTPKPGWSATRFMVAAANPLATEAGYRILKAGGTALDAGIAVQMVLSLVEPQSSGIGGGAFLLHWDGNALAAWDGRETAPAAADGKLFLTPSGQPMSFLQAAVGGRAVGTPGAVSMLHEAHGVHGRLPWATLLAPAIALAENGFAISPRLHTQLKSDPALKNDALAAAYFYTADGAPKPVGHVLKNPALAHVLRAIAAQGSRAMRTGPVASDIARRVREHPSNPGPLVLSDLETYSVKKRDPICTDWLNVYRVCGFPPPSSGHLAVMQMLGMLEHLPTPASTPLLQDGVNGAMDVDWLHHYTEAARLAYADRALYVADPDFVAPPAGAWTSLLDKTYLQKRAAMIGERSLGVAPAGLPGPIAAAVHQPLAATATPWPYAAMPSQPEYGTSHISIVDAEGRALAMTTTIEAAFGARLMSDGGSGLAGGFLLNNQLTDFSFTPADAQGTPIANRVEPGKRPRSSMSPTLVFDRRDNRLLMSLGSPGGAAIIHFTAKTLIGTLGWGLNAQQAIGLPNFGSFNGPTLLERGRFAPATVEGLKLRGHVVNEIDMTSGLQAIQRVPADPKAGRPSAFWFGGADPRREGVVMGE